VASFIYEQLLVNKDRGRHSHIKDPVYQLIKVWKVYKTGTALDGSICFFLTRIWFVQPGSNMVKKQLKGR